VHGGRKMKCSIIIHICSSKRGRDMFSCVLGLIPTASNMNEQSDRETLDHSPISRTFRPSRPSAAAAAEPTIPAPTIITYMKLQCELCSLSSVMCMVIISIK
jgi:hypothetical protein